MFKLIMTLHKLSLALHFCICHEMKIKHLVTQNNQLSEICFDNGSRCCIPLFSFFSYILITCCIHSLNRSNRSRSGTLILLGILNIIHSQMGSFWHWTGATESESDVSNGNPVT